MKKARNKEFFFSIVRNIFCISYFDTIENKLINYHNFELPDNFENELNFEILIKFFSEKIKKIEKENSFFIESANILVDFESQFLSLSIKNLADKKVSEEKDVMRLIKDAKQLITKLNSSETILHILINKYLFDKVEYLNFPENLFYSELILDLSFITLKNDRIKKAQDIFKNCDVMLNKFILYDYSKNFIKEDDINNCIAAKRVNDGANPSEVKILSTIKKDQGFFEKLFNLIG